MTVPAADTVHSEPCAPATAPDALRLYGLMITREDGALFEEWCADQLPLYDDVVCLDGSESATTRRIAERYADRLIYLHERDFAIPHKTDHGLRRIVHEQIVHRFGTGHWIMCCHADEFCYHDPRKIAQLAEASGFDSVAWFSPHFYPHPDELADWPERSQRPITERFRHYHWSLHDDGLPWIEDRLYRAAADVAWDEHTHGNVRPHGLQHLASLRPILRHFKVAVTEPEWYERQERCAHYRQHWIGQEHRTGLPFPVRRFEDLFVRSIPKYTVCNRFDGVFDHPWNMGEQYRPGNDPKSMVGGVPLTDGWSRYRSARRLLEQGSPKDARIQLHTLLHAEESDLCGRAHNDAGVLEALGGNTALALDYLQQAEALLPGCAPIAQNRRLLTACQSDLPTSQASIGARPVRVAILSLLFNWPSTGGGIVHTVELADFLGRAGYDVRHFYARHEPWGIGRVEATTPFASEALKFEPADWNADAVRTRFRQALERFQPDKVIITDSWNGKVLLAEAANDYPVLLRLQALECLCPLNNVRLLSGPDGARQCNLHQFATPNECRRCLRDNAQFSGGLHRAERALAGVSDADYHERLLRIFREAEAVLVVNPLTEAMLAPYARQVRVVTAGMDPARFPSTDQAVSDEPTRTVLFFAGLVEEWMKGFRVLHEACARLWRHRQDFRLVATGEPPGEVDAFTCFIGWQSQDQLPKQMQNSDIIVIPTIAQEALGRTAVEAMAAGRPVVASRIGGLPFTIVDGLTGLLAEPGNAADLAEKLAKLLDDAGLRARMGLEGRKRFEQEYDWHFIIRKHYIPLLGGPLCHT